MINTIFNLTDASGNELFTRIHIQPYNVPAAYSGSIISADAVIVRELYQSCSVNLVPGSYACRLFGRNTTSEFIISLPTSSDGTTASASDYLVNYPAQEQFTASYAQSAGTAVSSSYAVTASYALNGGGGGGGTSGVTASNFGGIKPNFTPPGGAAMLAIDTSTGDLWYYYSGDWN